MRQTWTWYDIAELMRMVGTALVYIDGISYILSGVQREDGSGKRFILHLTKEGDYKSRLQRYVEIID